MRRTLMSLLAVVLLLFGSPLGAAEEKLVIYTAYEENELKDFREQFKKGLVAFATNQKKMAELKLPPPRHVTRLGEDKAFAYYEALDKNLSQITKSGGAPGRMAASGETPIGIALAYEVEVAKKQGAPIDVLFPADGVAWTFEGNALVKAAEDKDRLVKKWLEKFSR